MTRLPLVFVLSVVAVGHGCSDEPKAPADPVAQQQPAVEDPNAYGFEVWHADFPQPPHLSPRNPGRWFDRTRRRMLERVVLNLQGACTKPAWTFAKNFFTHPDEDAVPALVESLDEALLDPTKSDLVENLVEALGRTSNPEAAGPLLRALDHSKEAVRNKVMRSLATSGTADAVRAARPMLHVVDGRGVDGWLQAVRRHLPPEEAAATYRELIKDRRFDRFLSRIVQEVVLMEPAAALASLQDLVQNPPPALRAPLAGLRHATGDAGGTALLRDSLRDADPTTRKEAVESIRFGDIDFFLNDLLRLTTDPDFNVRLSVIGTLQGVAGENVDLALETLVIDEVQQVRRVALATLVRRGQRRQADRLAEIIRTESGSKVTLAMEDLIAIGDGAGIQAMVERMNAAPLSERQSYVRAIALTQSKDSFAPLRELFLKTSEQIGMPIAKIGYFMANCRGAEKAVLRLFAELPASDYRRRAMLMSTLANIAADREGQTELQSEIYEAFRGLLHDREEIPQIRLLALELVRRDLRLDDAVAIRKLAREEEPRMRSALTDFLFEFF